MQENKNIIPHQHKIKREDRNRQKDHKSLVVWFTGLSGSGKSTIASRLEELLVKDNIHTYILDGDNIRTGLNKELRFTRADRQENLRRIAEVSKLFIDAGVMVLSAFISPLKKDRKMIAKTIGTRNFVEIHIATSIEECERRDVKGLYKKARKGEIDNFTGISAPYEAPDNPDLRIQTKGKTPDACAKEILEYLLDHKTIKKL